MSDYNPEDKAWSIMTKSRGGTVSVIRDLTEREAARTYERLDEWYGKTSTSFSVHKDFLKEGVYGCSSGGSWHSCSDGDIEIREVFGPPGWEWFPEGMVQHWPKFKTIWTDAEGNILPDEYQQHVEDAQFERKMQEVRRFNEPEDTSQKEVKRSWAGVFSRS